jgi:hypothetical protein
MPAHAQGISWTRARSCLANTVKADPTNADAIADARRELKAARLAAYIERVVDEAPVLTGEQRDRLALLLRGTPNGGAGGRAPQ